MTSLPTPLPLITIGPISTALGSDELTNEVLAARFNTTPEVIFRKIGVESRPIVPRGTTAFDLAWAATEPLLADPLFRPDQLSLIIAQTSAVSQICPTIACRILDKLQADGPTLEVIAFDILAACTGWLYGLKIAADHLQHPPFRNSLALIVTSEPTSTFSSENDFGCSVSFGDAATATLVFGPDAELSGQSLVQMQRPYVTAKADREWAMTAHPVGAEQTLYMNGGAVRQHTVPSMASVLDQALKLSGLEPVDLDLLLAHQTNHRLLADLAQLVGLSQEKVPSNLRYIGNTSSSSLPLLLADLRKQGTLKPGYNLGFTAFGGGYTYGAAVARVL